MPPSRSTVSDDDTPARPAGAASGPPPSERPPSEPPPSDADEETLIEEAAREKLGLRRWDRPLLYRETADAATDTDLPFWTVLLLSGAIATLGLILNSTAVVIGAMLVAPLLGPLLGLSLALAVGDGRLAVQTAATILVGAVGVVALAALLTAVLPFHDVTDEIAARTRPTTLDLVIAIASGLAGAVVTASREKRLSASIPGVAIAVALIPPLGVAGFGIGTGFQWALIRGALLLFGANLAGIVLSGLLVFLLVGMHRSDVLAAARAWHEKGSARGLTAALSHVRAFDRLRVFSSPWARVGLVLAFMAAVSVPLTTTLDQILRETTVRSAIGQATAPWEDGGRAFVLDRQIGYGEEGSTVRLRLATTRWVTPAEEAAFVQTASALAGEPVALTLEQVLASAGTIDSLAASLPSEPPVRSALSPSPPTPLPQTLADVRRQLDAAGASLAVPDSVRVLGATLAVGTGPPSLRLAYAAPARLPPEAEALLARQAARTLGLDESQARTVAVLLGPRALPDSAGLVRLADALRTYGPLRLTVSGDSGAVVRARRILRQSSAPMDRTTVRVGGPPRARFAAADSTGAAAVAP